MTKSLPLLKQDPNIQTVTIALNYVCNSRCRFCFIEPELGMKLPDATDEFLTRVFQENRQRRRYKRLILAGAEATLRSDLARVAERARREGGFESVRLQTNGRKLADRAYLESLIRAGIDEYFVSIHAGSAELDRELTRAPKSFAEMRAGLRNLRELAPRTISNTCVTRQNYLRLDELAGFLLEEGVRESHFWAFIEFGDVGQSDQHVSHHESVPHVLRATRTLCEAGSDVVLSWFPECLLGEAGSLLVNHRDDTLIHDEFSSRAAKNGRFSCAFEASCARFGKTCMGLHERHVALLGDERAALAPFEAS